MANATEARREAVERLVEICDQPKWDVGLILSRGAVPVLYRKALRAAAGDAGLLDEIRELYPIASGKTEPLIDAALRGLPDHAAVRAPAPSLADVETALAHLEATA